MKLSNLFKAQPANDGEFAELFAKFHTLEKEAHQLEIDKRVAYETIDMLKRRCDGLKIELEHVKEELRIEREVQRRVLRMEEVR